MWVLFIVSPAVVYHISECHKSGRARGGLGRPCWEVVGASGDIHRGELEAKNWGADSRLFDVALQVYITEIYAIAWLGRSSGLTQRVSVVSVADRRRTRLMMPPRKGMMHHQTRCPVS